jgi:uncharacterized RDD family membrane protein YckC
LNTAGIVSRSVAAVIDLLVVGALVSGLYLGVVLTRLMLQPSSFSFPVPNAFFSTAVMFSIAMLYLAACWFTSGCTAGAVVMGLRVEGRRGGRVPLLAALLRAAGCVVFPVGLLLVVVDGQRRSVQDLVLGTRVVYARPGAAQAP